MTKVTKIIRTILPTLHHMASTILSSTCCVGPGRRGGHIAWMVWTPSRPLWCFYGKLFHLRPLFSGQSLGDGRISSCGWSSHFIQLTLVPLHFASVSRWPSLRARDPKPCPAPLPTKQHRVHLWPQTFDPAPWHRNKLLKEIDESLFTSNIIHSQECCFSLEANV